MSVSVEWHDSAPRHWRRSPLGSHFVERKTQVSDRDFAALSVTKAGVVPQLETVAKTDNNDARKLVRGGDFVINSRSDRKGSAGIAPIDGSVSVINIVLELRPTLDPAFTHHLLRSGAFQEEFYRWGAGIVADLWSTRYSSMKAITLALPVASEQKAIAAYLDHETAKIDALIAKQEQLIATLSERRRATVAAAVLGKFAPLAERGASKPIGSDFSVVLGKMLDASKTAVAGTRELPYLRAANVREAGLDCSNSYAMPFTAKEAARLDLRAGDLLVVEGGATVGRTARVEHDLDGWSFQKTLNRVRSTGGASTWWLGYVLSAYRDAGVIAQITDGSTFAHLTAEKLRALRVPVVEPAEQHRIVAELDEQTALIDELIAKAEQFIALAKERRAALITAAVTGQIAVPGFERDETTKAA